MRPTAFLKLLPKEMEAAIINRHDLRGYEQRLNWVRAQLSHTRAVAQASALAKNPDDMQIGALQNDVHSLGTEPMIERIQALEAVMHKGKGKGGAGAAPFRPPSGIKGGGKGSGGDAGKGGAGGGQTCWHCGKPGHRRQDCPTFTAHLQAQGKGRGAGTRLNDLGADDAGSLREEEGNADEWCLSGDAQGVPPPPSALISLSVSA